MNIAYVKKALDGLAKEAQAATNIRPGVAFKDLTPEEQAQRRAEYQEHRKENGRKMREGKVNTVSDFQPGAFLQGFGENLREKGLSNLASGAKSMGLGIAKGIADLPSDIVGLAGGTASFVKNKLQGKGWKDSWNQALQTGGDAADTFDRYSGLGWAKSKINAARQDNMTEYMKNNDMDSTNLSGLDRAGLAGLSVANGAGQAIGIMAGPGAWTKAMKAPGATINAVKNPAKAMQALRTRRVANKAFSQAIKNPEMRQKYIKTTLKDQGKGMKINRQHLEMAKRKDMGFSKYHAQGLKWKAPVAVGWAGTSAIDPYTKNKEYYEFGNRLRQGPGSQGAYPAPAPSATSSSYSYPNVQSNDPEGNLAYYINM